MKFKVLMRIEEAETIEVEADNAMEAKQKAEELMRGHGNNWVSSDVWIAK